jgi:hypothetical protein
MMPTGFAISRDITGENYNTFLRVGLERAAMLCGCGVTNSLCVEHAALRRESKPSKYAMIAPANRRAGEMIGHKGDVADRRATRMNLRLRGQRIIGDNFYNSQSQ